MEDGLRDPRHSPPERDQHRW